MPFKTARSSNVFLKVDYTIVSSLPSSVRPFSVIDSVPFDTVMVNDEGLGKPEVVLRLTVLIELLSSPSFCGEAWLRVYFDGPVLVFSPANYLKR